MRPPVNLSHPLFVGDDIELRVQQVPADPQTRDSFLRPEVREVLRGWAERAQTSNIAVGKFRVTVLNKGKETRIIPALRTDGDWTSWEDSLVILSPRIASGRVFAEGKPHLLSGAGKARVSRPAELASGEQTTGMVDVLTLQGVGWPSPNYSARSDH